MEKIYVYFTEFIHKDKETEESLGGHPKPGKVYRAVKDNTSIKIPVEGKTTGLMGIMINASESTANSPKWKYSATLIDPNNIDILQLPNEAIDQIHDLMSSEDSSSEIIDDTIKEIDGDDTIKYNLDDIPDFDEIDFDEESDEPEEDQSFQPIETTSLSIVKMIDSYNRNGLNTHDLINNASSDFSSILLKDKKTAAAITILLRHVLEKEEENSEANRTAKSKENLIQYNNMPIMAINKINKYIATESTDNVAVLDYILAACHYLLFEIIKKNTP